jgi:hypothetical protein
MIDDYNATAAKLHTRYKNLIPLQWWYRKNPEKAHATSVKDKVENNISQAFL